ncbi:hypothetical protein PAAL109150_04825 [Paenibacillus alkaliterrae]
MFFSIMLYLSKASIATFVLFYMVGYHPDGTSDHLHPGSEDGSYCCLSVVRKQYDMVRAKVADPCCCVAYREIH